MWPGQQPGDGQAPQQPNPYQQPGYQQPNPYQQPPGQGQSGYAQPGYGQPGAGYPYAQQPPGGQWQSPSGPGDTMPPQPPQGGGGKSKTTAIAIGVAVAVVVAAVTTGVIVLTDGKGDGGKKHVAAHKKKKQKPKDDGSKPVVPGWQAVVNSKRYSAFDVPKNPDWQVPDEGTFVGFGGSGMKPLVAMSGPAFYKPQYCENYNLASMGTKGGQRSKNTKEAAKIAAGNFAIAGWDEKTRGKHTKLSKPKPFRNSHGIHGYTATAVVDNAPKKNKCSTGAGKAVAVSWINSNSDLVIWVGTTDLHAKGEKPVSDATFKKMMGSLRNYTGGHDDPRGD